MTHADQNGGEGGLTMLSDPSRASLTVRPMRNAPLHIRIHVFDRVALIEPAPDRRPSPANSSLGRPSSTASSTSSALALQCERARAADRLDTSRTLTLDQHHQT